MAYTLNRRLSQLVDSSGQLNTGKIPNDYISSDHIADNTITSAMLHTGFKVSTSNLTTIDTNDLSEGSSNLYFTNARADARIAAADTNDLSEGSSNLYFTNARVDSRLASGSVGNISLADSVRVNIGSDNDLALFHTGSNGVIHNTTGALRIRANTLNIQDYTNEDAMITANSNGSVDLYHNNVKKLETTSTGATVTGVLTATSVNTGQGDYELYAMDQNVRTTDSPAFAAATINGTLTVTGNLAITGDINSYNVTDLDVTDKTITLGAGQTEANSGGSGIIIDGSSASILWDETNDEWDFNKDINVTGGITTSGYLDIASRIRHIGDTDTYLSFANADDFRIVVGNSTRAAFNTSKIHFNQEGINQDFQVESNNSTHMLFVDASTDRVGIGTDTPAFKLSVDSGTTDWPLHLNSTDNKAGVVISDDDTTGYFGVESSKAFMGLQAGIHVNNLNVDSSGNVGIGTVSPDSRLHIDSGTAISQLTLARSGQHSGLSWSTLISDFTGGGADLIFDTTGANTGFGFRPRNSSGVQKTALIIAPSGHVGIGTTTPSAEVPLTAYYSATSQFHIGGAQAGISNNVYYNGSAYTNRNTSVGGALLQIATDGSFAFRRATSGSSPTLNYSMYIDSLGKVGIGTTSPATNFDIKNPGDSTYTGGLLIRTGTSTSEASSLYHDNNSATTTVLANRYDNAAAAIKLILRASSGSPVTALTALGSGNVGIGTDSPEGRLHVEVLGSNATPPIKINRGLDGGRIQLQYSSNETGYGEIGQMYAGTGRTQIWIGANLNSFSTGHNSSPAQHDANYASWFSDWDSYRDRFTIGRIASGTTSRVMLINSSGNVGIGTDSPTMPLSVQAASNAYAISMHGRSDGYSELYGASNDGSTKYSFLQSHSAQTKLYTLVNAPLLLGTNSTERMRLSEGGVLYLGSGHDTAAPSDGVIAAAYASGYNNAGGDLELYGGRSTGDNAGGEIRLFTGAAGSSGTQINAHTRRMTIAANGSVGIGTDSPGFPLDVSASIGSTIGQTSTYNYGQNRNWAMRTNNYGSANWGGWSLEQSTSNGGTPSVARIGVHINGNVGINMGGDASSGLTSINPATALHVGGDITVGSADAVGTSGTASIRFQNDNERSRITSNYASGGGGQMGFWTDTTGGSLLQRMYITNAGHVLPGTDNTYDLGSTSSRWRNIYTTDLHLSNEGKPEGNQVDGTTGNWTIQEGEEHLYIINNKSGKKYKFALEEIS